MSHAQRSALVALFRAHYRARLARRTRGPIYGAVKRVGDRLFYALAGIP